MSQTPVQHIPVPGTRAQPRWLTFMQLALFAANGRRLLPNVKLTVSGAGEAHAREVVQRLNRFYSARPRPWRGWRGCRK